MRGGVRRNPNLGYGENQARWEYEPKKKGGGTFRVPGREEIDVAKDADPGEVRRRELLDTVDARGSGATGKGGKLTSDDADQNAGDLGQTINDMVRAGVDASGPLLSWLTEETDASEAPRNAGQWLMNLLSTGTYAGARAAEGIGAAAAKGEKAVKAAAERGDALGVAGAYAQGVGEGTVNAIGGAARGVAEGFGAREETQHLATHGAVPGIEHREIEAARQTGKHLVDLRQHRAV